MELIKGRAFQNHTSTFLAPILNSFDVEFKAKLSKTITGILAYGIQDFDYNDALDIDNVPNCLFLVFDTNGPYDVKRGKYLNPELFRKNMLTFLEYFRQQPNYLDDYIFDMDQERHCVVIDLGTEWKKTYDMFIESKYSKMYSKEQLFKCAIRETVNGGLSRQFLILTKDDRCKMAFQQHLRKIFNITDVELRKHKTFDNIVFEEYELPWEKKNEIFNYKGE